MNTAKPRGRPSRLHSRNGKRRTSRSPPRSSKGNKNKTNKRRAPRNRKQNTKNNQPGQQHQNRRPAQQHQRRRRVCGYFFCEECNEIFASDTVYETLSRHNEMQYSTADCPLCAYPISPFEIGPFTIEKKRGYKKSEQRQAARPVCSRCKNKECRCRCTRCECHNRGCGKLFKDCHCETRQFGSYQCLSCNNRWSSGYTFVRGRGRNGKALYGQQCKKCNDRRYQKAYKWRELEAVECPVCGEKPCNRDPPCRQKPHQQSLCKRCKNKAVPCSSRSLQF